MSVVKNHRPSPVAISIQRFCYGSTWYRWIYPFSIPISIQRLLRFNGGCLLVLTEENQFQYNACYGSTLPGAPSLYVLTKFQYNACYGSTFIPTIHIPIEDLFQYNACYGSTRRAGIPTGFKIQFQYNACYGSTIQNQKRRSLWTISIQRLLRFNDSPLFCRGLTP